LVRNQTNTIVWSPHFLAKTADHASLLQFYQRKSLVKVVEDDDRVVFNVTIDGKVKAIGIEAIITHLLNSIRRKYLSNRSDEVVIMIIAKNSCYR
jgi:hypothetical protein